MNIFMDTFNKEKALEVPPNILKIVDTFRREILNRHGGFLLPGPGGVATVARNAGTIKIEAEK